MVRSSFLLIFAGIFYAFRRTPVLGESVFSRRQGDVMFGALFPISRKDEHGSCAKYRHESTIWISALNFALEEINSQEQPRYNVSFGVEVRDTCSDEEKALEQSVELVRANKQRGLMPHNRGQPQLDAVRASRPVLGVIWDSADERVATLLDLFKVPHVSFTRWEDFTTWEVSHSKFSFSPVSIEYYQALALADLARHFAWSSVSLVYSQRNSRGFRAFQHVTRVEGICLATTIELSDKESWNESWNASAVVKELQSEPQTRVVILLSTPQHSARLLKAAEDSAVGQFTWILVDGRSLCSLDNSFGSLDGSLALVSRAPLVEQLQTHDTTEKVKSSVVSSGHMIPLNTEAWKHVPDSARLCETTLLPWQRQAEAQAIVNSVYMFFHAFWRIVETVCQEMAFTKHCQDKLDGSLLYQELKTGINDMYKQRVAASNLQPHMTENTFSLINIQKSRPNKLVTVGSWESSWNINHQLLRWRNESAHAPESLCGAPCEPGYIRVSKESSQCCWSCASCNYKQYVKDNYTCADCVRGYWPSRDYRKCEFQWRRTLSDCLAALVAMVLVFSCLVL